MFEAYARRERQRLVLRKLASQVAGDDVDAFVVEAPAQIGLALDVDQTRFSKSRRRGDPHGLAERVSADFQNAQAVHLADASPLHIHQQRSFLNHFPDARLDQVVALHFRRQGASHVRRPDHRFPGRGCVVMRLARQVGDLDEARRHLVSSPRLAHAILQHRRECAAVERVQIFFLGQRAQPPRILRDDAVAHRHLFVKFHAHLENLAEVLLVLIQQLVQGAVTDEDHLYVDVDGFRFLRAPAERIKHFQRLNFQPVVVQRALQRAPHADFRQRFQ